MEKNYYIYLLTNSNLNVLYIGITNDLIRRIYEHKHKLQNGFTYRYNVDRLVYFEIFTEVHLAIEREKQIKGWSRKKKDMLVNRSNPQWKDLYEELIK